MKRILGIQEINITLVNANRVTKSAQCYVPKQWLVL